EHVLSRFEAMADLALSEHLRPALRVACVLGLRGQSRRKHNRRAGQDTRQLHHAFSPSCEAPACHRIASKARPDGSRRPNCRDTSIDPNQLLGSIHLHYNPVVGLGGRWGMSGRRLNAAASAAIAAVLLLAVAAVCIVGARPVRALPSYA